MSQMTPNQNITPRNYFYLSNGQIIKRINELPGTLSRIDDKTYSCHVTSYKNDFAKWIYDVFREETLSSVLGNIKSKEEMARILSAYLKQKENITAIRNSNIPTSAPLSADERKDIMRNASDTIQIQVPIEEKKNGKNEEETIEITQNTAQIQTAYADNYSKPGDTPLVQEVKKEESQKIIYAEKKEIVHNIENATEFFEKNPVIMSQVVDAKRKNLSLEPLAMIRQSDDTLEHNLEHYKDKYAKVYERLSIMRKNGFVTSLVEMMIFRIPPKIKIFEVSKEKKDEIVIIRYINEAIEELNNMKE
jgi:hypothetical protein